MREELDYEREAKHVRLYDRALAAGRLLRRLRPAAILGTGGDLTYGELRQRVLAVAARVEALHLGLYPALDGDTRTGRARIAPPTAAKPIRNIAQVAGSGTAPAARPRRCRGTRAR